jgi:hypothetical protein
MPDPVVALVSVVYVKFSRGIVLLKFRSLVSGRLPFILTFGDARLQEQPDAFCGVTSLT